MRYRHLFILACLLVVSLAWAQAPPLPANISQRQLAAGQEPGNWLLYGGNYSAWRYSTLTQITRENVSRLTPVWTLPTFMHDGFESSPIVVDGVMYFTTPWNHYYAVDAATGKIFWHLAYPLPTSIPLCCGAVNRGVAVGDGKVIAVTLNAHLIALDARTGVILWDVVMDDYRNGYSATVAPQIIGNKVIAGISGADFGVRGHLDAYDVRTGAPLWRFWTVPGPGEPGNETWAGNSWKNGGGTVWMPPTYDPATNTIFAGVGNPGPDLYGGDRAGDNLYTECTIALDADTGRLKWYYQTVPHDVWDLDNVVEPIIDDITVDGARRQVVMFAAKNGFFYVLDRTNGAFIYAIPYVHKYNWGTVGPDGKATLNKEVFPAKDHDVTVYPGASGGKEWCPVAYDPVRKRIFIPVIENGHIHRMIQQEFIPGLLYWGGTSVPVPNQAYGHVAAIDVEKKTIAWDVRTKYPVVAGVLCTATGLVITGTPDQQMLVLDADTGKLLYNYQAISGWHSAPISYTVGGKQYIAFANGWGGWVAGFDLTGTPGLQDIPYDNTMYVFAVP